MQKLSVEVVEQGLESPLSGNSLVVQWLGLGALMSEGPRFNLWSGTKILQTVWYSQKKTPGSPLFDCRIDGAFFCLKKKEALLRYSSHIKIKVYNSVGFSIFTEL